MIDPSATCDPAHARLPSSLPPPTLTSLPSALSPSPVDTSGRKLDTMPPKLDTFGRRVDTSGQKLDRLACQSGHIPGPRHPGVRSRDPAP